MSDLIDRQDAKDVVDMELDAIDHVPEWVYDRLLTALDKVPSAEPEQLEKCPIYGGVCLHPSDQCYECPRHAGAERKTGHWVEIGDEPYDEWECDMCGFVIDGSGCIDPEEYKDVYKFCPNCGAKMEGEEE